MSKIHTDRQTPHAMKTHVRLPPPSSLVTALSLIAAGPLVFLASSSWSVADAAPRSAASIGRPIVSGDVVNNSISIESGEEASYRTVFDSQDWSGNIEAREINADGEVSETKAPQGWQSPASRLNAMDWDKDRIIITGGPGGGIPFRWDSLHGSQKGALQEGGQGESILQYIRGDRSGEQPAPNNLRRRRTLLGDFLHTNLYLWNHSSAPGSPSLLYAGANDGMLHVFNAKTGQEEMAYIPSMLIPKLKSLARPTYSHTHYVDGQISMARVTHGNNIKTVLVGTLGRGGPGLYALDMTNPTFTNETATAKKLMWEIGGGGSFAQLGEIHGSARIARLQDDTPAAIFGNGFNPGGNGKSTLYVVNLISGNKIAEISVGNGSATKPAGLAAPALLDENLDGKADFAYAGDVEGNLWKFDLTNYSAKKLFSAEKHQAITTPPVLNRHPNGGQMVIFGTGRLLTAEDEKSDKKDAIYGIWDGAPKDNKKMLKQNLGKDVEKKGLKYRSISDKTPDWSDSNKGHMGWEVELLKGERLVGEEPLIHAGRFYFVSTNPTVDGGENWLIELDTLSGSSQACPIFDLDGDGVFCRPNGTADPGDLLSDGKAPVAKLLRGGIMSQPRLIRVAGNRVSTIYNWNDDKAPKGLQGPGDLPEIEVTVIEPPIDPPPTGGGPGVSGGHFDYDVYVNDGGKYDNEKHVHEYDDKYNVTGVNMLNPSESEFRLSNVVKSSSQQFKILLMNQYLNPAVVMSIGGSGYQSVKYYGGLAGDPNSKEIENGKAITTTAQSILDKQPVYTTNTINTFIFNLPKGAFQNYEWWGKGGDKRVGLIPTQTGCVNGVSSSGVPDDPGPKGERYNGAFTIQIIKANTPASALELNYPNDLRYGWRVKAGLVTQYVLGEYTAFWHHGNKKCFGEGGWKKDPPQDFAGGHYGSGSGNGSGDPTEGVDSEVTGAGGSGSGGSGGTSTPGTTTTTTVQVEVVSDESTSTLRPDGVFVRVRTITYTDEKTYELTEEVRTDGTIWAKEKLRDGTVTESACVSACGDSSFVNPDEVPLEQAVEPGDLVKRESWLEVFK